MLHKIFCGVDHQLNARAARPTATQRPQYDEHRKTCDCFDASRMHEKAPGNGEVSVARVKGVWRARHRNKGRLAGVMTCAHVVTEVL